MENTPSTEKRLGVAEGGVDLGDFGREEGAALKAGEVSEGRIFVQQGFEFEPG